MRDFQTANNNCTLHTSTFKYLPTDRDNFRTQHNKFIIHIHPSFIVDTKQLNNVTIRAHSLRITQFLH